MKKHDSMRGWFAWELYQNMQKDRDIILLTGDLGYGMFDYIRAGFPKQFINVGASEQSLLDIGVGLAMNGKIPFCYSITTFLLYRGFETLRTYINHEQIPVRLIGGGRDKDYAHDGYSHWSEDAKDILNTQKNILQHWPKEKEEIPQVVRSMIAFTGPSFVSLRR